MGIPLSQAQPPKKDAEKAISSEGLKMLIQKFDDKWNYKVKRTRELLELSQEI